MTDHHSECGHNHEDNPFTPELEGTFQTFLTNLFRISVLTTPVDQALTGQYTSLAMQVITASPLGEDYNMQLCRGLTWELGRMINVMTGTEAEMRFLDDDGNETSDLSQFNDQKQFGANAMAAFMTACGPGDLNAGIRVLDAVVAEAHTRDDDPRRWVITFMVNAFVSIAYTTAREITSSHGAEGALESLMRTLLDDDE